MSLLSAAGGGMVVMAGSSIHFQRCAAGGMVAAGGVRRVRHAPAMVSASGAA